MKTLPETIALLELRLSVEVEATGLSAERRTDAEAARLRDLMEQIDGRHPDPSAVGIHYDYDFHLPIAESAKNAFMHGFLNYLRPLIVPRFQLGHVVIPDLKDSYHTCIHCEHAAIVQAIEGQTAKAARMAMRRHLANSLERIRAVALASGVGVADESQTASSLQRFETLLRPWPAR